MTELKPCPFCGGIESLDVREVHTYNRYCADMYCIECRRCLYCTMNFDTKDELYAFWNTRPAEDALTAEVERLKAENERLKKVLCDISTGLHPCTADEAFIFVDVAKSIAKAELAAATGKGGEDE